MRHSPSELQSWRCRSAVCPLGQVAALNCGGDEQAVSLSVGTLIGAVALFAVAPGLVAAVALLVI